MTVILLSRKIGHGQKINPTHVEVPWSKVKVTVLFNAKPCPLNILKSL